ncbi:MAG: glycosyltransferase family 4 protein [Anaerolineae bacterium]|nr:glycosyltransferase family 4 protein [Anaerolineae bacterium]
MKIAFVYDVIYPYVKGGGERRYYELARRLNGEHEIHLWGMKFWDGPDVIQNEEGITLHGVCPPMPLYVNGRRSIKQAVYYAIRLFRPLIKEDYDLIECPSAPFFPIFTCKLYSLLKRRPLVVVWLEYWGDYWYDYLGRMGGVAKFIEKVASKLPDHIIAISNHTRDALASTGVSHNVISSIPLGINLADIQTVEPASHQSDIIFVGRLIKEKNVDILLHVVQKLLKKGVDVQCNIVGDGPEKERLEDMCKKLEIEPNIHFLGFVERSEHVYGLMKASKVFVFPSTREGFGLVIPEANACGLPAIVIQHEQNAATLLIDHGNNGFICDLEEEQIVDLVYQLLTNKKAYSAVKTNVLTWARQFDWEVAAQHTADVYQMVLEN